MTVPPHRRRQHGVTLIELMITTVLFTVGALAFIGAMSNISKSIYVSKGRSLANNLVQEKIEALKNSSYHRLLVTTAAVTAPEAGLGAFEYDQGYYPPEDIEVGGINFTRRVLIQKVTESGGNILTNNWYDNDTGLKLITTYVIWQQGTDWKKVTLTNLRDNPNRKPMNSTFSGTVTSGGSNLQDATVIILQNPLLRDVTDAGGAYSIKVGEGTYDLAASKSGYFSLTKNQTIGANATISVPFDLTAMGYGTITGTAYINNRIYIAEVCASVDADDNLEYVVLYNPTKLTGLSNIAGSPTLRIQYLTNGAASPVELNPDGLTYYVTTTMPPNSYFLLASSPTVNGVMADAYYSDGTNNGAPENRIPLDVSGGVAIVSLGYYDVNGTTWDAVGWGRLGGSPYGPSIAREGTGLRLSGGTGADGLASDETLVRMAYSSSTATTMDLFPAGIHAHKGNAYDTSSNNDNWVHLTDGDTDIPKNSATLEPPESGTPAEGALVFVSDGLSASAIVSGAPTPGAFTVTNVATGTWEVIVSSEEWVGTKSNIVVTNGVTTSAGSIFLGTPTTGGYITGRVIDSAPAGIPDIAVKASGDNDTTDSNGYYRLQVDAGIHTVIANSDNQNSLYTTGETTGVVVDAGHVADAPNIVLYQGGHIQGFVTPNGVDGLPGIPIVASNTASGAEMGSVISDNFGYFLFPNLPVATYSFFPQLEVGESASPSSLTKASVSGITVFAGTFTVTNAFGTLDGSVNSGGSLIRTGVLIVAVPNTTTIGSVPDPITSTVRGGSVYYYAGSSNSEGEYSIRLRGGTTYNVYAWYTTVNDGVPYTVQKSTIASITAGGKATRGFTW